MNMSGVCSVIVRPKNTTFQYGGVINLKEVMLYDPMGAKISPGALTFRLSSTGNFGAWGNASKCNDGDVTSDAGCHSSPSQASYPNPTLTITFSCPWGTTNITQVLSRVDVYNRVGSCCQNRILDFKMDFLGPGSVQIGDSYVFNSSNATYNIIISKSYFHTCMIEIE